MTCYTKKVKCYKHFYKGYYKDEECTILHREDGPAMEWDNGDEEWYINGKRHRDDGPALKVFGCVEYYKNGKLHREDGPAAYGGFSKLYYLEDVEYSEDEFLEEISKRKRFGDFA